MRILTTELFSKQIFFSDSASSALYVVTSSLAGLFLASISINYLGPELYGVWVILLSAMVLGNLGEQGIGLPIVRLVSKSSNAINDDLLIASILPIAIFSVLIILILSLISGSVVDFYFDVIGGQSNVELILPTLGFIIFCFLLSTVYTSFLIGFGSLIKVNYIKSVARMVQFIGAYIFFSNGFGLWAAIGSLGLYHIIVVVLSAVFLSRNMYVVPKQLQCSEPLVFSNVWSVGGRLIVARIAGIGIDPFFRFSLGAFIGLQYVAFFDLGFKVASLVVQIPRVALIGQVVKFREFHNTQSQSKEKIHAKYRSLDLILASYFLACSLCLVVGVNWFLQLWLSSQFDIRITHTIWAILAFLLISVFAYARELFIISIGNANVTIVAYLVNSVSLIIFVLLFKDIVSPNKYYFFISLYGLTNLFGSLVYFSYFRKIIK